MIIKNFNCAQLLVANSEKLKQTLRKERLPMGSLLLIIFSFVSLFGYLRVKIKSRHYTRYYEYCVRRIRFDYGSIRPVSETTSESRTKRSIKIK